MPVLVTLAGRVMVVPVTARVLIGVVPPTVPWKVTAAAPARTVRV